MSDDFDRQRRRVLWSLPTGLYLIGSRVDGEVNLMTANLVVQVCLEPKLVGAAIEAESVTARLISQAGLFTISLLDRAHKDVVRKFVKPVTERQWADDGAVTHLSGQPVQEVGPSHLPVLAAAAGWVSLTVTKTEPLGSHTLYIGEVDAVGGDPSDVLRMEDTRMHYGG